MATENPKVSGYVPQEIFDCLLDFKEKRSLKSVSLALTVVLSEYFQVDQKVDRQTNLLSGNDFVSREQFESLENKFSELPSNLLSELNKIIDEKISGFRHELLYGSLKLIEVEVIESNDGLLSEPLSSLPESFEVQAVNEESELQEDEDHLQLDLIDSVKSKEDLEVSEPTFETNVFRSIEISLTISSSLLRKRLGLPSGSSNISKNKKRMPQDKFYNWLQNSDPDQIAWKPLGGDLRDVTKGWIPDEDTSSELLSRLKEWLATNHE